MKRNHEENGSISCGGQGMGKCGFFLFGRLSGFGWYAGLVFGFYRGSLFGVSLSLLSERCCVIMTIAPCLFVNGMFEA